MRIHLSLTFRQYRLIMRALCIALADSMSAVRSDSLTYPADEWKSLIDTLAHKVERRGQKKSPVETGL
jgi:hypothetical protein